MKLKILIVVQFFVFSVCISYGQNLETKTIQIKNIGLLKVPSFIDSLGHDKSRMNLLEKSFEVMSKSGVKKIETQYKIDLFKTYLSDYDTSIGVLISKSAIIRLLNNDISRLEYDTSVISNLDDIDLIPLISLQRKFSKNNSSILGKYFLNKNNRDTFMYKLRDFYISLVKTLIPQTSPTLVSSTFYNYLNKYPTVKLSINYSVDGTVNYREDVYMILREFYQYIFKFQYRINDESSWKYYEQQFFNNIIFY